MIGKLIEPAAFGVAFTGQLTAHDIASYPNYNTLPNMEKGKFLANSIVGRITSFNPFPQYGTPKFSPNVWGPFNKYTGFGLGLMVLGEVLPKGMGHKSLIKKYAKGTFWGGIIGGFLDPATGVRGGATTGNVGMNAIGFRGIAQMRSMGSYGSNTVG